MFVHLHTHSEYSILDGLSPVSKLVAKAADMGMPAIALTDHGNMLGCVDLYKACRKHGIKPIYGCEVYMTMGSRHEKSPLDLSIHPTRHLILLAKNIAGYRNLCHLVSLANSEGFYYKPRIDRELLEQYRDGIICLSACIGGEIQACLHENRYKDALASAKCFKDIFGEDFYLECHNHGLDYNEFILQGQKRLSQDLGIQIVAANDAHYLNVSDATTQDILLCISTKATLNTPNRVKFPNSEFYLKSYEEMSILFEDKYLEASLEIESKIENFSIFNKAAMPNYPTGDMDQESFFVNQCRLGLEDRLVHLSSFTRLDDTTKSAYRQRLDFEIAVISKMGFVGYFLVVWDFIREAKHLGVPVGPGRGSAAGSLVTWALNITDIDPIKHDLYFERFLNPERVSMPDIDIDFCCEGRQKVIDYVVNKWGKSNVANISTVNRLKPKSAIKDVARVLGKPFAWSNSLTQMIPSKRGKTPSLNELSSDPYFMQQMEDNADFKEVYDVAKQIEGVVKSKGVHPAGVVIAPDHISNFCATFCEDGNAILQQEMNHVEDIGLIKMDFLGIEQLTHLQMIRNLLVAKGVTIPDHVFYNLDDADTFALFSSGNTEGVFQFESAGMQRILRSLKPDRFDDIVALNALYRPGPLDAGVIDDYIERRHGRQEVKYLLPELKDILQATYGIIIYQEQIMQIAQKIAGFTLGEADLMRRAIGKKDMAKLSNTRADFVNKGIARGFSGIDMDELFRLIELFAEYGFNKSHSVAYARLAFETAYYKAHHPQEFWAALLTVKSKRPDDMAKYISSCKRSGIKILPPDINTSGCEFLITDKDELRFGINAIKGISSASLTSFLNTRDKKGGYKSLDDIIRSNSKSVLTSLVPTLIRVGALDRFGRRESLETQYQILSSASKGKVSTQGMTSLFPQEELDSLHHEWANTLPFTPWSDLEKLKHEYAALGCYLSEHPADKYANAITKIGLPNIQCLYDLANDRNVDDGAHIIVGGLISKTEHRISKNNNPWCLLTLEDATCEVSCLVFSSKTKQHSPYEQYGHLLREGAIVLVHGKLSLTYQDEDTPEIKIMVNQITSLTSSL